MEITSVKALESGYLVNGSITVPNDPGNRHYREVQAWIAEGNTPEPMSQPTLAELTAQVEAQRQSAYHAESDPIFFRAQRGEATLQDWEAKVDEIRARYPYPDTPIRQASKRRVNK